MATALDYIDIAMQYHVIPTMIDTVSQANVLINLAIRNASYMDGGSYVAQPVLTALPTAFVKAYTGPITFPDNFQNNEQGAVYPICFYGINIELNGPDLARNRGAKQTLNLLKSRMSAAEIAMRQRFGTDIYGDGTTDGGASFVGLKAYVDDGTNYDNYAGLSRAANPGVWGSTVLSPAAPGNRALTTGLVDVMLQDTTVGTDRPNLHITTRGCVTKMAQLIQPIQRAVTGDLGSWGFKNIAYQGYPVVADDFVPTSPGELWYGLNTKYMQMWFLTGRFFQWIPFEKIPKTDTWCAQILTACAFVGNRPGSQGVINSLDSTL